MGVIANALANDLHKLKDSHDTLIAMYEQRIEQLESEIKRLKEER